MTKVTIKLAEAGRCKITHQLSGESLLTDLPSAYGGQARSFSSTDLVAAAVGSCIMSSMELVIEREKLNSDDFSIEVEKRVSQSPKMISFLGISVFYQCELSDKQLSKLRRAAETCPVKKSLSNEIEIVLEFKLTS